MSSEDITNAQPAVRFSRVMNLRWVVAWGSSVSVGLLVFILLGIFTQEAGQQTLIWPYIIFLLISLPIILTYAERAAVLQGSGGALNLAKTGRRVWILYGSAWLLLGGYATLVALLGWGAALHLDILSRYFFGHPLDLSLLAVVIIGLFTLNSIFGISWSWKSKGTYIYICILFLLFIILRNLFVPPATTPVTPVIWQYGYNSRATNLATLMVAGLWGIQYILNVRDEIHRPTRTLLPAMLLTIGLAGGLGLLAAWSIVQYGGILQSLTPLIEITSEFSILPKELLITLYAWFGLTLSLAALNQAMVQSLRLIGEMTRDGFLPKEVGKLNRISGVPIFALVIFALFSIALVMTISILTIVGLAAITFLWVTALVHLPDALRAKPELPNRRFPKLPFHPLFPWLTIFTCIFMPLNLNSRTWSLALGWLLVGALYYVVYARRHGLAVHRQEVVIGDLPDMIPEQKEEYVVLVGVANTRTTIHLLQMGARLAQARDGVLLILHVLTLPEQMPSHLKRESAHKEWAQLSEFIKEAGLEGVRVKPLVRLAPSPVSGILEAVREEGVDFILLGWEGAHISDEHNHYTEPILDPIIKWANCDVAILRGTYPDTIQRVLVPTAGGPHASTALELSQDLLKDEPEPQIFVEHMVVEYLSPDVETEAQDNLQTTLKAVKNGQPIEQRIREVDSVKNGILRHAKKADLLLMGVSKEGFLEKSFFGGFPVTVAVDASVPTVLTRGHEPTDRFGFRRFWEFLTDMLPTLTLNRQADVFDQMRSSAQPSIDFFVLITLASAIAALGLLQNSAAVIIGAMLVAPLMSPILAMAMSMVRGDLRLLQVATESTIKGSVLAIAVGVVVVLISPITAPTTEILARTEPNVLDLMVALASGAAAGYALSRKEVAAALPGVAIAAALVPPLCVVGYGIGTSQLDIAGGSLLLFITNLIAIILAASLTFLALGFHPPRKERSELMRGLSITITSLFIVSLILFSATITSIKQINRENNVHEVFQQHMVTHAAEVLYTEITRNGNAFEISAMAIDYIDSEMTPQQLTLLETELSEAAGGPVTVDLISIPGTKGNLEGADVEALLTDTFKKELKNRSAEAFFVESHLNKNSNSALVSSKVIALDDAQLTDADLSEIQKTLSKTINMPVTIDITILAGEQRKITPAPTLQPEK